MLPLTKLSVHVDTPSTDVSALFLSSIVIQRLGKPHQCIAAPMISTMRGSESEAAGKTNRLGGNTPLKGASARRMS
jgi:hypothetical protein